ncbi:ACT domain-containing protein [Actinocorallia longicatena]|uniref:ACT domain-containing protein n=1 Tax=Actinocorallia longicatena TaxID=111803 RepID=A0ABP6QKH0_9ACTN
MLTLGIVPSTFTIGHLPATAFPEDDEWIALVRAPEGLTVVREADPWTAADRWTGFYGEAHGLDVPGVLSGLLTPLAAAGIEVFVASTFHADLVLVPERLQDDAVKALESAGYRIQRPS